MCAHLLPSLVGVHPGVGERRRTRSADVDPPASLPTMSSARVYLSSGRCGLGTIESIKKLTSSALLWYTLVLINVALPLRTWTPPPCQKVKHISTKGLVDSSKDKHTHLARLAYTLMLASVAVPSMERPPPTCQTQQTLRSSGGHWKLLLGRSKASGCTHFLPPCFRTR